MKQTIFDIAENTLNIESTITALEAGEMTDEQATEVLYQALIHTEGELKDKVQSYAVMIRQFEAHAKARKDAADALAQSAKSKQANADRLKATLKYALETLDMTKVETELFTVAIQKNGGVQPLIIDEDATTDNVDAEFVTHRIVADFNKDFIRKMLEQGEDLKFARLGERGTSLRIR
jgi:hypothetical protein